MEPKRLQTVGPSDNKGKRKKARAISKEQKKKQIDIHLYQ